MKYIPDRATDVQHGHAWDSIELERGQELGLWVEMFAVPLGGRDAYTGRQRTPADTSMMRANAFPQPQYFAVHRILFTFSRQAHENDIYSIAEQRTWTFWLDQKQLLRSPIIALNMAEAPKAPIRICDFCKSVYVTDARCPGCGATQFSLSTIGGEAGHAFALDLAREHFLTILPDQFFRVTLEGEPYRARRKLKMWCHFEGLHHRPIQ